MIPGFSRNWRRTSSTTSPPTRPTACIASEAKRNGIRPPMKRPGDHPRVVEAEELLSRPSSARPLVYESKRTSAASAAEPIA